MKNIALFVLLFHLFSYVYAQNTKVMEPKKDELNISLKTKNSTWKKDEKMFVTVEITNSSSKEIEFDFQSIRFHLSPIKGGFTKTFIVPTIQISEEKSVIKIKNGETISQTFDLAKLPFVEFESTDSGRKFGEIPDGKYRLTAISADYNSSVLIDFCNG